MGDYTSFTPWKNQIEDLTPSVRSNSYRISRSGLNVRLYNSDNEDTGMVAYINDRGNLGGSADLVRRLKPILAGPTDEEQEAENTGAETFPVEPPATIATTTLEPGSGSLEAFARSGAGGLRNERNEEAAIIELQEFLVSLGEDTGGIDGKYGPKTNAAVLKFQRATGLVTDGDAGPNTINKIIDVRNDLREMQRLLSKLEESISDISKFGSYKSLLMNVLLEADLSEDELARLRELQSKYSDLRRIFPESTFENDIFGRVDNAIETGGRSISGTSTASSEEDPVVSTARDAIDTAEVPTDDEESELSRDLATGADAEAGETEPSDAQPNTEFDDIPAAVNNNTDADTAPDVSTASDERPATQTTPTAINDPQLDSIFPPVDSAPVPAPSQTDSPEQTTPSQTDSPEQPPVPTRPVAPEQPVTPTQPGPTATQNYQFQTNANGEFYAQVREWPFEVPRSFANSQEKIMRITQVAGGQWAATLWDGSRWTAPIRFNTWQPRFRNAWLGWLSSNGYNPRTGARTQ